MNKKYIAFSFMAVFALTLVSAGLVNYLSNTERINMNIESPIVVSDFTGDTTAFGGETRTITTGLENLANAQIKGRIEVKITNTGITLEDFETLTVSIVETRPGFDPVDNVMDDLNMMIAGAGFIDSIDTSVDNELTFVTTERTFEIGETWDADIALGFKDNALGNYKVAVTVIPVSA
jgi:hypothetical protein